MNKDYQREDFYMFLLSEIKLEQFHMFNATSIFIVYGNVWISEKERLF